MEKLRWLAVEEGGQGLVEYALIFMLVAAMSISILTKLGLKVAGFYAEAEAKF
ncbi:MAG: Flp family type IVb pilin [Hungatella hathewayi]|nr:Flp family type IVb pilin [Hungatella hathewayi]